MPKQVVLLLLLTFLLGCTQTLKPQSYNFNVEKLNEKGKPSDWLLGFSPTMAENYPVIVDSAIKHGGNYSLKLFSAKKGGEFGSCSIIIPSRFAGKFVVLKGFLKTEDVKGYAGLWMRLDGENGTLGFDNMGDRGVVGTNDWKEFSIRLPFSEDVEKIFAGALLVGEGAVWVDDLSVQIDEKDLSSVPLKAEKFYAARADTMFNNGSGLNFELNAQRSEALAALGLVWGFLKYHHPAIAEGKYNWDAELMRIVPELIAAKDKKQWMAGLEKWVDKLPPVPVCSICKPVEKTDSVILKPDYGNLFKPGYLSSSLAGKLKHIQTNSNNPSNYYVSLEKGVSNPRFTNENAYSKMKYPDAGFRLLALYRYWNFIQYFFPHRHKIEEDWNKILTAFIPTFINAKDSTEYVLACLKLIATVHDTHANIWGPNTALRDYRGNYYPPFSTIIIEDQLVVRNFYTDTAGVKQLISKGDIITHIEGQPVKEYIKKVLPLTPASNYSAQLRDIPNYVLRGNTDKVNITVNRNNKAEPISIPRYNVKYLKMDIDYDPSPGDSSYKIIKGNIGYVYPGKYKNDQLPAIMEAFKNTKGIVVDMRCYPSDFMPFTFGNYIKSDNSPFVLFTTGNIQHPGLFTFGKLLSNGGNSKVTYKGKVVVIVNEETQSQAEYTTMAFQSSPNVSVIGSTTAGADGNVSGIVLPGGVSTMISGIGVYYPDKKETQRTGVKIDVVMKPTLKAYREGKDELLEKAVQLILE